VPSLRGPQGRGNLVQEQAAFLLDVARLISYATECDWVVTGGELWRTPEQQAEYVRTGRSKTLNSNHLRRLAIDLNFFRNGQLIYDKEQLRGFGQFWEMLNPKNRWGGNFKNLVDVPHFERNV
jgi:peptidoglycan L-alanyl-D-glutamate endopeptidase CwlK